MRRLLPEERLVVANCPEKRAERITLGTALLRVVHAAIAVGSEVFIRGLPSDLRLLESQIVLELGAPAAWMGINSAARGSIGT